MYPVMIDNTMRLAFLAADIGQADIKTVRLAASAIKRGVGQARRFKLWNKDYADGPRPNGVKRWRGEL